MKDKILLFCSFLVMVVSALYLCSPSDSHKVSVPNPSLSSVRMDKLRSESELHLFWAEHLEKIFTEDLSNFHYHIPLLNERYKLLMHMIIKRYGRGLVIHMTTDFNKASVMIAQGSMVQAGVPTVELVIPTMMNIHDSIVAEYGPEAGEQIFELNAVIGLIHELDHLAHGYVSEKVDDLDALVENERHAWAATCQYTIAPLIEKEKLLLDRNEQIYYQDWVNAGRDVESPVWKEFIRHAYAQTRKK